jgi:hypothetical protein
LSIRAITSPKNKFRIYDEKIHRKTIKNNNDTTNKIDMLIGLKYDARKLIRLICTKFVTFSSSQYGFFETSEEKLQTQG